MTTPATSRRKLRRLSLLGSVRADEVLTCEVLRRRLGWDRRRYQQAVTDGLAVLAYGRRDYVMGAAVLKFFGSLENKKPAEAADVQPEQEGRGDA